MGLSLPHIILCSQYHTTKNTHPHYYHQYPSLPLLLQNHHHQIIIIILLLLLLFKWASLTISNQFLVKKGKKNVEKMKNENVRNKKLSNEKLWNAVVIQLKWKNINVMLRHVGIN